MLEKKILYSCEMEMYLWLFFMAHAGSTTLILQPSHPQHHLVSWRYAIYPNKMKDASYAININDQFYNLLMQRWWWWCSLMFLPVLKVGCLKNPYIEAYSLKPWMLHYTGNIGIICFLIFAIIWVTSLQQTHSALVATSIQWPHSHLL